MASFLFIIIFFFLALFACFSRQKVELGIYAAVFYLPFYLIRLNIFGVPSTAFELGIYMLFVIWFIKNYHSVKLAEIIPDKRLKIGVILLLSGALISTVFSGDPKTSAGILKGWFFDPFLFFIILTAEIRTLGQKTDVLKALFFSGAAVAVLSLFYWFGYLPDGVSFDGRLHAFYSSPNYLAMYLAIPFIIGVWFLLEESFRADSGGKDKKEKYFWSVPVFIIGIAIYCTFSYMAWFAVFSAVFLLVYLLAPAAMRKIFFGGAALILVVLVFSQSGTSKFENLKNLAVRSSYSSRLMIWRSALEIGKDNPIIGIGPGNFQKYYLDYQPRFSEPYLEWAVPQPHNIFLAFWLETGIIGLLGFLALLIWFFKYSFALLKSGRLDRDNFSLVAVLAAIMVYMVVHGLSDTTYWKNDLAIEFWLELALLSSVKR